MNEMTTKQEMFVKEYLIDFNATRAAIRAGYSPKTANEQGTQLLVRLSDNIQTAIEEKGKLIDVKVEQIILELAKIAFSDIKQYLEYKTDKYIQGYDKDGQPVTGYRQIVDAVDSSEVDGSVIQEVSLSKDGVFKFRLHDKIKALEMLGRYKGIFADKAEVDNKVTIGFETSLLDIIHRKKQE